MILKKCTPGSFYFSHHYESNRVYHESGLADLWSEVYVISVAHMMTGHSYVQALRARFLTQEALLQLWFSDIMDLSSDDVQEIQMRSS